MKRLLAALAALAEGLAFPVATLAISAAAGLVRFAAWN